MQKWQQQFSIGYFVIALVLLFALQTFFASPHVETITYSQFKALAKKGLLSNVVIGEKTIRGEIKPEGLKEVLSAERLKELNEKDKEAKTPLPFMVVRVEDPELISDLEKGGVQFKGEVTNEWVATVLSWVVPVVLFFLLWNYLFKRMGAGGGMMQIGKSKAKVYIEKKTGVTFADVEGIDEAERRTSGSRGVPQDAAKISKIGWSDSEGCLASRPSGDGENFTGARGGRRSGGAVL
jgi:cell division protease FtsH